MIKLKMLKDFDNDGDVFVKGEIIEVDTETADYLTEKGIACVSLSKKADEAAEKAATDEDVDRIVKELKDEFRSSMPKIEVGKTAEEKVEETGGYKSMGHFVQDVYKSTTSRSMTDQMLKYSSVLKQTGMNEGVGAEGGFLVPTEFRATLMRDILGRSEFLNRCQQIPMATNSIEIPTVKETTRADGTWYGGVRVYNVGEGQTITRSKPTLSKVRLQLLKKAAVYAATNELLEDSPISLEPVINTMITEAIYKHIDDEILNGNGVGQFLGVLNSPSLVTQDAENNQVAGTINTENILKMWSRLKSRSQGSAVWIANQTTFQQLAQLALEVGAAGAPAGLLGYHTNGVTGRPTYTLLGAPLILTEHAQAVGSVGDIILADLGQYLIGQKAGGSVNTATSMHLHFLTDEMAFRFTLRMDGKPWEQSALTPKRGAQTLSSFITLAAR